MNLGLGAPRVNAPVPSRGSMIQIRSAVLTRTKEIQISVDLLLADHVHSRGDRSESARKFALRFTVTTGYDAGIQLRVNFQRRYAPVLGCEYVSIYPRDEREYLRGNGIGHAPSSDMQLIPAQVFGLGESALIARIAGDLLGGSYQFKAPTDRSCPSH
jgi:hypothetical protein